MWGEFKMNDKVWPAIPNKRQTVTDFLPSLSSVLLGFIGAYFVSIVLSDHQYIKETINFTISAQCNFDSGVSRKIGISIVNALGFMFLLASMLNSIAAKMFEFRPLLDSELKGVSDTIKNGWETNQDKCISRSLTCFHFSMPSIVLSLVLLTEGLLMLITCALIFIWYGKYIIELCCGE